MNADIQGAVLAAITGSIERRGLPPTLREIQATVGVSSTSVVARYLRKLEDEGHIRIYPGTSRGIVLVDRERQ